MSETNAALINPKSLFEEIGEDKDLLLALVETAKNDLPNYLDLLRAAASESDYDKIRQYSHAMKTTLAHWQAVKSFELSQKVENLVREGKNEEAVQLVPELDLAVREVLIALEHVEDHL